MLNKNINVKQRHLCRFSHQAVSLDFPQCLRSSVCATVSAQSQLGSCEGARQGGASAFDDRTMTIEGPRTHAFKSRRAEEEKDKEAVKICRKQQLWMNVVDAGEGSTATRPTASHGRGKTTRWARPRMFLASPQKRKKKISNRMKKSLTSLVIIY